MDVIFAGGKFRAKSKFANIAKISSTRKIGVIQNLLGLHGKFWAKPGNRREGRVETSKEWGGSRRERVDPGNQLGVLYNDVALA